MTWRPIRSRRFLAKGQMKPEQAEIATAEEGSRQAQDGARHPEKSRGLFRQGVDVKFGFVAKHRGAWPVVMMCEALGVSRSGFYAWLSGREVAKPGRRSHRAVRLGQSFVDSDRTYGARRVWRDVLAAGERCGLHRIERLMRIQALRARPRRRGVAGGSRRAAQRSIAPNVLDRQFEASRRTRSGSPTSRICGPPKVGSTSRWCWICTRAASSAGRCSRR